MQSTVKQFVREWGEEGRAERAASHAPVLAELRRLLPNAQGTRVLLPGARALSCDNTTQLASPGLTHNSLDHPRAANLLKEHTYAVSAVTSVER